jgi:hypothetical protein
MILECASHEVSPPRSGMMDISGEHHSATRLEGKDSASPARINHMWSSSKLHESCVWRVRLDAIIYESDVDSVETTR